MSFPAAPYRGMDHAEIEETQLAERYVLGRAGEEERARFEEHFVDCPACQDRLEAAEGLRSTLKDLAAARLFGSLPAEPLPMSRRARRVTLFAAAAGLAAGALSTLLYFQLRQTGRELALARDAAAQAQAALGRKSAVSDRPAAAAPAAASPSAPVAAPVFLLNLTRGAEHDEAENRVVLPEKSPWATLVFDRPDGSASRYRVRLTTATGRVIEEATVTRSRSPMLSLTLPASSLAAGDHVLTVQAMSDSEAGAVIRYTFRVSAAAGSRPSSGR